ncbi:MAG: SDR family oxidoreductase [Limisphaerales bacterium]
MKVLVTGGAGFTGSRVVPILLKAGHEVRCLVRPTTNVDRLPVDDVELVHGDFEDSDSVRRALEGQDVLINIASLGFGHGPDLVKTIESSSLRRAVFVGTTAIFTKLNAPSKVVRKAAEDAIRASGLEYTILRPTMIYGGPDDRNMCRLIKFLNRWPMIPVFGSGRCLQQPVHVEDVAQAAVDAVFEDRCIRQEYNISGAAALTYNDVIATISELLGRRRFRCYLPASLIIGMLKLTESIGIRLPVKAEQVQRLNEDKAFAHDDAAADFGYAPRTFRDGIAAEIKQMNLLRQDA